MRTNNCNIRKKFQSVKYKIKCSGKEGEGRREERERERERERLAVPGNQLC
jgi:hypothetical protein